MAVESEVKETIIGSFSPKRKVAIDTETTGLRPWHGDRPFGVSLCDEQGRSIYMEWKVNPFTREVTPRKEDLDFIRQFTMDPVFEKVYHNAGFDVTMLRMFGVNNEGIIHDTSIAAKICNNLEISYGLKDLAWRNMKIPKDDESALKEEVKRCKRLASSYNKQALKDELPLISLGEAIEEDYWLPSYYGESKLCEQYCNMDTFRTMALHLLYDSIMQSDEHFLNGYLFEQELWYVVNKVSLRGMRMDLPKVREEKIKAQEAADYHYNSMVDAIKERSLNPFGIQLTDDEMNAKLDAGDFNPQSSTQMTRLLYNPPEFGGLGLETERKTKTGNPSADKNALRELMYEPFVRDLNSCKAAKQAISLFFQKFIDLHIEDTISPGEICLRPGLNQMGTTTARFSCSDPNLQQVSNPKSSHNLGGNYQARAPFGPRKGYCWYSVDYSQQELRIFADVGNIPFLLGEIEAGRDPNTSTANQVWGGKNNQAAIKAATYALDLGREEPSTDLVRAAWDMYGWNSKAAREFGFSSQRSETLADEWLSTFNYEIVAAEKSLDKANSRQRCKCVIFAKIYGGGPKAITELLFCKLDEARSFFNDLDARIPEIKEFINYMTRKAAKDGYVINPYGRKIRVERDFSYKAVNYIVQSTAAMQIKDSMIKCDRFLTGTGLDAHIIMPIHDELLFEIRKDHAHKWLLRHLMELMEDNGGRLRVPVECEMKRAPVSWDMKEPIEL